MTIAKTDEKKTAANAARARSKQLDKLQALLKIKFRNKRILNIALTHSSYINEHQLTSEYNERLEYLGDSVLGLVVNEYLYRRFENYKEGELARIKSVVVSESVLSVVAGKLNLGNFLLMGKGEETTGGRERPSILANTLEAVIGAYYLDGGLKAVRHFILRFIKEYIEDNACREHDPKTALQEYAQKKYKEPPEYRITDETGPDHNKQFTVSLYIIGKRISSGTGSSKRKAEMNAAAEAMKKIEQGDANI